MSVSAPLDPIGRHLAEFPQLVHAVDPAHATARLAAHFAAEYPHAQLEIDDCQVERVYLVPGRSCKIRYRLTGRVGNDRFDRWIHGKMRAGRIPTPHDRDPVRTSAATATIFEQPATSCAELGMTLRVFPHDDALPALSRLVDETQVRTWILERRDSIGLPCDAEVGAIEIDRVRYRPGKHCLLRYRIHSTVGGESVRTTVYSKAYATPLSEYVFQVMSALREHPDRPATLEIPRPIALLRDVSCVWQAEWTGVRLDGVDGDPGLHSGPSRTMIEIAHLLAGLHTLRGLRIRLRPARTASQALDGARDDASSILRFYPMLERRVDQVWLRLTQGVPSPRRSPRAVLHGTFKPSQLLRGPDGRLGLLDYDGVRRGDPHIDLAEFHAACHYRTLKRGWSALSAHDGAEQFLEAYQRSVPWRCEGSRLSWYTATFLLRRLHSSLRSLEWTDRGHVERALDLISEITDGVRR